MAMKHRLIAILLMLAFSLHANVVERYYFTSTGNASMTSDAPLELIKASSKQMMGVIDPIKRTFAFKIPMKSFDGFNSDRQKDQFNEKFLETDKYPEATFTGKLPYEFSELKKGMQELRVFGILKIHGVQKERTIPINLFMADQIMVIQAKFSVPLDDHNIEVPAVLFRKLAPEIKMEVTSMLRLKFGSVDPALALGN